jgi:hypothetical protein
MAKELCMSQGQIQRNITKLVQIGLAGHVSRAMMEHYSHTRMEAKRAAVEGLSTGLIESGVVKQGAYTGLRHKTRHKGSLQSCALSVSA